MRAAHRDAMDAAALPPGSDDDESEDGGGAAVARAGARVCLQARPRLGGRLVRLASEPPRPGERLRATKQVAPARSRAALVAQAYYKEPATLDERKFDFYLLVTASDPPRAYLCREGRAPRPCRTRRRRAQRARGVHARLNYTLNKREAGFVAAAAAMSTARARTRLRHRDLRRARDAPRAGRRAVAADRSRRRAMRRRAVAAARRAFRRSSAAARRRATAAPPSHPCRGFQLVGLDVLFTAALEPICPS